jgi:hypothetical protein
VDKYSQLDFSAAFEVSRGLEVFLEASNLMNDPYREYYGDPDITYQLEYYSWLFNMGIKWQLR